MVLFYNIDSYNIKIIIIILYYNIEILQYFNSNHVCYLSSFYSQNVPLNFRP